MHCSTPPVRFPEEHEHDVREAFQEKRSKKASQFCDGMSHLLMERFEDPRTRPTQVYLLNCDGCSKIGRRAANACRSRDLRMHDDQPGIRSL